AAVERAAEIVERLLAVRALADQRVGFEPDQQGLVVEVGAAAPRLPLGAGVVQELGGDRGVDERTPRTAGTLIEIRGDVGQVLTPRLLPGEAAARGENESEVLREAFVDPQ